MQISLRGPAGRVHDLVTIRPGNKQEIVGHLTTEGETYPLVHNGYDEFADEFGGFIRLSRWRKDETVCDIVSGLNKTVEGDAFVRVRDGLRDDWKKSALSS